MTAAAPTVFTESSAGELADAAAQGCPHAAAAMAAGCPAHASGSSAGQPGELPAHKPLPVDALESARAVTAGENGGSTAVLLVNHGSRAPMWRRMLLDVHAEVADRLLAIDDVAQVRTGFMEYTEPSIASQLRELDEAGIERVLIVPLLLTISDHSFDDIPAISGQLDDPARLASLAEENIEVYRPAARVEFSPLLDFSGLVRTNLERRLKAIVGNAGGDGSSTGLILVGYGSAEYDDDWNRFFEQTRAAAEADLGITASAHAWCGHLVDYKKDPTLDAVNDMLSRTDRVVVVPQLVSYDPMFQERIIGRAVRECSDPSRVLYSNDSILPEPAVGEWVVSIAEQMLGVPVAVSA
jgi:sirohydrochlorin ferrochelatase